MFNWNIFLICRWSTQPMTYNNSPIFNILFSKSRYLQSHLTHTYLRVTPLTLLLINHAQDVLTNQSSQKENVILSTNDLRGL